MFVEKGDKFRNPFTGKVYEVLRLKDGLAVLTSEDGLCTVCTGASTIAVLYEKLEKGALPSPGSGRMTAEARRNEPGGGNSL